MEDKNIDIEKLKRERQLAIAKATQEMLRQAKETALSKNSDEVQKENLRNDFDRAIQESKDFAKSYLNANDDDINNARYRDVDKFYVEKYKNRLAEKNLTDEQVRQKNLATVTTNSTDTKKDGRRVRLGSKKKMLGEDYKPIDKEEELMKLTMVTDEKQIEENIKKNKELEQQRERITHDKIAKKIQENIKKETDKKVNFENAESAERANFDKKEDSQNKNIERINNVLGENTKQYQNNDINVEDEEIIQYDFDFSNIPSYVQYDVIPLPSKGRCYPKNSPLRCGRIPVAYLTASDENVLVSPNAYQDGKLLDIIVGRKILDKRINENDLCIGDRDAIVLWLRATAYGDDFPISVQNPRTGNRYDTTVKLSQFKYKEFTLKSDDKGLFEYKDNKGNVFKYKYLTSSEDLFIEKKVKQGLEQSNKSELLRNITQATILLSKMSFTENETNMITEDLDEIKEIVGDLKDEEKEFYPNTITEQMVMYTMSVNGNEDRDFIRNYVENLRAREAMDYRNFVNKNKPGVDFNFTINFPESDGGGSQASFLQLTDSVFINI